MTAKDFRALLADAKLPERTVAVCLRGDLAADFEAADRELEQTQQRNIDSLDGGGVGELVERIEALQAEMREHTYDFRLRALPRAQWRALVAAHPPRKDDETGDIPDADRVGVNAETFYDALIRACLVDPELDDGDWTALVDKLTDRQYDEIADAAWGLNRRDVDIPFSRAASRLSRASGTE